jgi:Cof subfamily protein (haloacid dehalogenase superfamily)
VSEIKLVLADVDGTLVTQDKVLTERAVRAVRALADRSIRFAITSGRPPRGMAMLIEPLQLDGAIAGFNGGVFTRPDLSVIETKLLPQDAARETLQLLLDMGLDAWVYTAEEWLIRDPDAPHREREERTVRFPPRIVKDLGEFVDKAVKITGVSDDLDLVARAEAEARKRVGTRATAARSQPYYLDVTNKEANKGFVLDYLCKLYGLGREQVATLGDQPNDVPMFEGVGISVAMGQSSDEVKRQAKFTTASNEDEGFAKAVERYILGEGGDGA